MGASFAKVIFWSGLLATGACATSGPLEPPRALARATAGAKVAPVLGPRGVEQARYRIRHAVVGDLGEVALQVSPQPSANNQPFWLGVGHAEGSFLGIGERSTFRSEFNAATSLSTTWSLKRDTGSAHISDDCTQSSPGVVSSHRIHSKKGEDTSTLHASGGVVDPFGFLLRLRTRPPKTAETVLVLDGRALWKVTLTETTTQVVSVGGQPHEALRYALRSDPIDWHGAPSKTRKRHNVVIWLSTTPVRTPLALQADSPLGNVFIDLDTSSMLQAAPAATPEPVALSSQ